MNGVWFLFGVLAMVPVILIVLASGRPQRAVEALPLITPVVVAAQQEKRVRGPGAGRGVAFMPVVGSRYDVLARFDWLEVEA